ncbi:MAG: hypothetical protein WC846_03250 [Candidatus Gracilibacteria bacterium]|jgi:predicted class III extradiol MEMO1 family dioxygenase
MGRNTLLKLVIFATLFGAFFLASCARAQMPARAENRIALIPHHALVKPIIEQTYATLAPSNFSKIIIISPDHFSAGATHISPATDKAAEKEFGFTIHRDLAKKTWPSAEITGYTVKTVATEKEIVTLAEALAQNQNTLFIFSVDFSHYLAGDIARVHDLRSMDIIRARSTEEAASLEVDSPLSIEIMLRLLEKFGQTMEILRNTNPALDAHLNTFENTTHVFALSAVLPPSAQPPARALHTKMFFARAKEFYLGKTGEDRYLYGYDETCFSCAQVDTAVITNTDGTEEKVEFDYF